MNKLARFAVSISGGLALVLSISQQVQAACAQNTYVPTTTTYNGVTYATPVVANTSLLAVGNNSYITSDAGTLYTSGDGTSMTTTLGVGPPGQTLPAFSPATFPAVGGTNQTIKNGTLAAGSYGKVTIDSSATFSGGDYYISELLTKGTGDTLTMAAGNYFVDKWNAGNNFILIVSSGPVKIYTRTSFQVGNESAFNVSGSTANLQIYGYDGIQIQFGNANSSNSNIDFNGLLYVPGSNTNISFGNNNVIQGSILSGGGVQLGNNTGVIYDAATQAAIASIPIASSGNGSAVCYYELSGQSSGLTCAAHTLTIKACTDTSIPCATPYTGGASGTLSAAGTGMTVNWDGTTGGATGAGFVIPGGSSTVTKNVQVATAGSVVFGVTSANPAPANAANCTFGSPMCSFTAQTAGFIFSNTTTGNGYTIPAQVSGVATPALYLRAVQASTTNPAVCTPAIIGQTTAVNMGYVCNNPSSCQAGNLATINATAIAPSGTAVSLSFDGNGSAPITVRYDDVGQITLNASKTVVPFGGATAVTLNGSSNVFVVRPHHFDLSAIMQTAVPHLVNPAAADAAGARFVKAGEQFSVTVTAKNALGDTAANYGRETVPENVRLVSALAGGLGLTSNPPVSGSFGTFSNGTATGTAFTWNEAGIIRLAPSVGDGDYLGSGDVTGTTSGNVGRFHAASFTLTNGVIQNRADLGATTGSVAAGAGALTLAADVGVKVDDAISIAGAGAGGATFVTTAAAVSMDGLTVTLAANAATTVISSPVGVGTFTYIGEQMNASFALTAKAVDGSTTLQNYTAASNFAKLAPMAAVATGTGGPLEMGAVDNAATRTPFPPCGAAPTHPCLTPAQATNGTFASGVANVTVPLTIYRGNAAVGTYATLDIGVAPVDSDGATTVYDIDTVNVAAAASNHTRVGSTRLRYGRSRITSAYGSELLSLSLPVDVEYWDGSAYVTSADDSLSVVTVTAGNYLLNLAAGETVLTQPLIVGGGGNVGLSAPGAGNNGSVDITASSHAYLPGNSARATFGVYGGRNEFIYRGRHGR